MTARYRQIFRRGLPPFRTGTAQVYVETAGEDHSSLVLSTALGGTVTLSVPQVRTLRGLTTEWLLSRRVDESPLEPVKQILQEALRCTDRTCESCAVAFRSALGLLNLLEVVPTAATETEEGAG